MADDRHLAAGPVQVRLDHLEHEPGGDGRVERVAALSRTAIPAAEASQWVEATIPNVPASSGRVVNSETLAIELIQPHFPAPALPAAAPRCVWRCGPRRQKRAGNGRVAR